MTTGQPGLHADLVGSNTGGREMQATEAAQQRTGRSAGRATTPGKVGVTAFVLAAAVIVYGAYGDPHHKSNQEAAVPFLLIVTAVVAAAMFAWYVPKGLRALRE